MTCSKKHVPQYQIASVKAGRAGDELIVLACIGSTRSDLAQESTSWSRIRLYQTMPIVKHFKPTQHHREGSGQGDYAVVLRGQQACEETNNKQASTVKEEGDGPPGLLTGCLPSSTTVCSHKLRKKSSHRLHKEQ